MLMKYNHLPLSLSPSNPSRLKSMASFSLIIVVHTRRGGGREEWREGGREIDLEH